MNQFRNILRLFDKGEDSVVGRFLGIFNKYTAKNKELDSKYIKDAKDALGHEDGLYNASDLFDKLGVQNVNLRRNRQGINKVSSREMGIIIHEGEMVLPKEEAEAYRQILSMMNTNKNNYFATSNVTSDSAKVAVALLSNRDNKIDINDLFSGWIDKQKSFVTTGNIGAAIALANNKDNINALFNNGWIDKSKSSYVMSVMDNIENNDLFKLLVKGKEITQDTVKDIMIKMKDTVMGTQKSSISKEDLTELIERVIRAVLKASPNPSVKLETDYEDAMNNLKAYYSRM